MTQPGTLMRAPAIEATTLGDLLLRSAAAWPEREVLVFSHQRLTATKIQKFKLREALLAQLASKAIDPAS